nr:hypothetical protein [Tanacetum cinerariifolium]
MAGENIDNLTMEQYLTLIRGNQAPGAIRIEIGGNVNFEIKSQFMQELKEDTFTGNKNDDTHEHIERVLDIVSLFNILGVTRDAVMIRVFPVTLTEATKRETSSRHGPCEGGLPNNIERLYWKSTNDNERVDLEWEELSFDNQVRIKFGKLCEMTRDRILEDYWRRVFNEAKPENEKKEDSKEYMESKTNVILNTILEKADEPWFSSTSDDKNDLGGIIDQFKLNLFDKSTDPKNHQKRKCKLLGIIYKEPTSYDEFIDPMDEAYKERLCNLLGMPYRKPPLILIEMVEVTIYNIGPTETYTKTKN